VVFDSSMLVLIGVRVCESEYLVFQPLMITHFNVIFSTLRDWL